MANTKISALPAGAPAQVTDILPVDRAGTNVSLTVANIQAGLAPLASPALTGAPTAPTQTPLTSNTDIATTAYTDAAVTVETSRAETAEALLAPLASPALTGTPTAPTKAAFTNNTDLATTAYDDNNFKGVSVAGFREDFISNNTSGTSVTTLANFAFDSPWSAQDINSVAGTLNAVAGTFANPGQLSMATGATGTGDGLCLTKPINLVALGALGSNAGWEMNCVFKLSQTTSCAMRIGFSSNGEFKVDPPTDGIWVEYDTANSSSNTDFTWVTAVGSTNSYATTGSSGADTNFHHVRIRSTVSGTIGFTLDGGTEFTTTTDVTALALSPFIQVLTRTSSSKTLIVDFFSYMASTGRT